MLINWLLCPKGGKKNSLRKQVAWSHRDLILNLDVPSHLPSVLIVNYVPNTQQDTCITCLHGAGYLAGKAKQVTITVVFMKCSWQRYHTAGFLSLDTIDFLGLIFFCWESREAVLCIVKCWTVSQVSTHEIPAAPPQLSCANQKNISRHCQLSLGGWVWV